MVLGRYALALFVSAVCLSATRATASILNPGSIEFTTGASLSDRPELAGSVVAQTSIPFDMTVDWQRYGGLLEQRVVRESAGGALDFYHRLTLYETTIGVDEIRVTGYGGTSTDVDYRTDLVRGLTPTVAIRGRLGDWVSWGDPNGTLGTGGWTDWVFVRTDAIDFAATGTMQLFGPIGEPAMIAGLFAPIGAGAALVPEPASFTFLASGIAALLLRRRASR